MILCVNFCTCALRMCNFFYNFAPNHVQTMKTRNVKFNYSNKLICLTKIKHYEKTKTICIICGDTIRHKYVGY